MTDQPGEHVELDPDPGCKVTSFRIDITNRVGPELQQTALKPRDVIWPKFEASFIVKDSALYEQLLAGAPSYTVEVTHDLNPWHRDARGLRARARKLRDIVVRTWHKRVLRRSVVDTVKVTIPNCQVALAEPEP